MLYCRQHIKKFLVIISLMLLSACGTPSVYFSPVVKPQKASAESGDGGYGASWARPTIEIAVFEAIMRCQNYNPYANCMPKYINDRTVMASEAADWKSKYQKDLSKYKQVSEQVYDPTTRQYATAIVLKPRQSSGKNNNRVASKPKTKTNTSTSKGSSGSAFFVTNRGHIITNYHVIKSCSSNPKIKYNDKDIQTKVIAKDQLLDLALLKADLTNTKYVALSNSQPKKLQRIIASGYPFGKFISDDLKFTSGIVSSLKGPNDDSTLVQVDAALNPGNSGGPIVDEETGKLVAVSVMGMKKNISEGQNFGIKTSSVKNFLDANQVKVPTSWFSTKDVAKLLEDSTLYTFCN